MKIVVFSDSHCQHEKLKIPECDILISAGDYSWRGIPIEVMEFHRWLRKQPGKHKISVQGNHELGVEKDFPLAKSLAEEFCPGVHFIEEGLIEVESLKIWCASVTPWFHDWAYNRSREQIFEHWARIPNEADVLITHGPPFQIFDRTRDGSNAGCPLLMTKVRYLSKIKHHCFGHIHEHGGKSVQWGQTMFHNVSVVDERYTLKNAPLEIEL